MGDDEMPPKAPRAQRSTWLSTRTAGKVFYRIPSDKNPDGELYGIDATSSVGQTQDGNRIIGVGLAVRIITHHNLASPPPPHCIKMRRTRTPPKIPRLMQVCSLTAGVL